MSEVVKDANLGVKQHGTRACAIGRLADGLARAAAVAACLILEAQVAAVLVATRPVQYAKVVGLHCPSLPCERNGLFDLHC